MFPAYKKKDSSSNEPNKDSWLVNRSYKDTNRRHSRSRSRSRDRSSSTRENFTKKAKRSKSRSPRRKKSRHRSRSRSRSKSPRNKKKSSKHRRRNSSPNLNREELIVKYSENKTFLEDVGVSPEYAYREDKFGDRSYLSISNTPMSSTASYYRKKGEMGFDKNGNTKSYFKENRPAAVKKRYHGKDFQKVFNKAEHRQKLKDMSRHLKPLWDYQPRKMIRFVHDFIEEDPDNDEDGGNFKHHQIQMKTKAFNEDLRKEPGNIDMWIDYVDFQESAYGDSDFQLNNENEDGSEKKKKKSKLGDVRIRSKAIVEKKLSIIKSALDHNPKSVKLSIKRLDLSKEIMDSTTLNTQWRELLFLFPGDVQVWDAYLTFLTSYFTGFTLSKITRSYKDCLQRLQTMTNQAFRTDDQIDLEEQISHIVIKLWHLWAKSGHRERSVALFQALMELNLNAPNFPGYFSTQDKLASFERFWESSVPRFGEADAPGWSKVQQFKSVATGYSGVDDDNEEDELIANFGGKVDTIELWLRLELTRESKHWLPMRVTEEIDDDEIEDTDRIVLYDQLDGFLFQFQDQRQIFKLFLTFLPLLGLNNLYSDDDGDLLGFLGTQCFQDWLGINHPQVFHQDDSSGVLVEVTKASSSLAFVKAIFNQATSAFREPFRTQIMLLSLKHETALLVEDVSKTKKAKSKEIKATTMQFLEQDQSNTRVYISYAMALNKLEGYKSAKKVFDLAFAKACCSEEEGRKKGEKKEGFNDLSLLLYVHAAKLELKQGHCDNALWILALMAHKRSFEPCNMDKLALLTFANSAREKAKAALLLTNSTIKPVNFKCAPILPQSDFLALTFGLYWLDYLIDGLESCDFFPAAFELQVPSHLLEICHQIKCDIIEYAGNRKTQKLKTAILYWVQAFPRSTNALKSLTSLNVQTAVSSAFWRSISASLTSKNSSSPIGHLAVIKLLVNQFKMIDDEDNLGHLLKAWALLNEFVKKEPCRTCVQAWRMLMWTTKMLCKKNPYKYKAKEVFIKGLQDIPSAKVLGLDLIHYLDQNPQRHTSETIQAEVQDIFAEKEVRIRLPLQELKVLLMDEANDNLDEANNESLNE